MYKEQCGEILLVRTIRKYREQYGGILLVSTIRKYKEQYGEIIYYLLFIIIYLFIRNSPCKYHTKVQRTAWRNYLLFIIYYLFIY